MVNPASVLVLVGVVLGGQTIDIGIVSYADEEEAANLERLRETIWSRWVSRTEVIIRYVGRNRHTGRPWPAAFEIETDSYGTRRSTYHSEPDDEGNFTGTYFLDGVERMYDVAPREGNRTIPEDAEVPAREYLLKIMVDGEWRMTL